MNDTLPRRTGPDDGADPAAASIERVVDRVHARLPAAEAAEAAAFVRQYYAQVAAEDLAERDPGDLYGAALSHWRFARRLDPGRARLRVFNPRLDEHGWQSTHTVVELVNDDMPFLVDSITMEVNRQGLTSHLIVHPVMRVQRDAAHRLTALAPAGDALGADAAEGGWRLESLIHVEVDRRSDASRLADLQAGLERILGDVRAAVEDWQPMRRAVVDTAAALQQRPPPGAADGLAEDIAFLHWLADGNFTLVGSRDYDLVREGGEDALRLVAGSGLGTLREHGPVQAPSPSFAALPAAVRAQAHEPRALTITKSNTRSTVHRPGHLDYIGVKRFDAEGRVVGERRFLGLYTSVAYHADPAQIPLLRRKVDAVTRRAGFLPSSHAAKALASILHGYPRDELFQIEVDDLFDTAMGILRLGERQRTRLFVRREAFGRFYSCLIYVPRENYGSELRARIQRLLAEALDGDASEFSVQFADSPLARLLVVVRTRAGAPVPTVDVRALEQRIVELARSWDDRLRVALLDDAGEERGNALHERYAGGFAAGYRDEHEPRRAVRDIALMESLQGVEAVATSLYLAPDSPPGELRFKLARAGALVPLSQSLPMLEHMGVEVLEERPYEVRRADGVELSLDDFGLRVSGRDEVDIDRLRERFQDTFLRTWHGDNDSDGFNRLVLLAGLDWRGVAVLRGYARYMKQTAATFSGSYIQQALAQHPAIAADLVALFHARFDPALDGDRAAAQAAVTARVVAALDTVSNLDEDRILRQYLALVVATLRTNHFQRGADGAPKPVLALKFDSSKVPGLPAPRPMFEIFVSSPRVEGVHLRGGFVARGGLRWSDRMEDYRTEVLGLVKAQQVKNVVIVPVGSKGGFVLRRPPPAGDREALMKEGTACYRAYLRGLLDVTDNLVDGRAVTPPQVVRHDGDDAYLVVAADKGTATFSDIANATAAEYGFWLGDAFASGGSVGYDHKKMGITARGAWESVKRHFRVLGRDSQTEPFTVAGIGDMSGDVFGNGMLLSRQIRLVAAFDHRHIFVDPDPDAATSFAERERLFALPRSSWADYDATRLSAGGGVWPRSAKSIALSPQARAVLGLAEDGPAPTPAELMRAIVRAPVDLFYNGGIGTYVKARSESHADCGDRANDAVRVDGAELRCKVVVEGGNLGCTQLGRIEFALAGGLVNTDAIDNSAGVDCSDHEVNIKILLDAVVVAGELTARQRDTLLAAMTDEVAALVLRDNTFQNQVLAVSRGHGAARLGEQARYLRHLVADGRLDRAIEFLPDDEALAQREAAGVGLTTPEFAVLLAYHKMALYDAVLASAVPDDPYIATALQRYFPARLSEQHGAAMQRHPLKREIIATHVVNSMVNRVGPTFVHRLHEQTGATPADIVRAYVGAREIFGLVALWRANEALDAAAEPHAAAAAQTAATVAADDAAGAATPVAVDAATQHAVVDASVRGVERGTMWLLQQRGALADLAATIARFAPGVAEVGAALPRWLTAAEAAVLDAETARLAERGVPPPLAQRTAQLDAEVAGLDIVLLAADSSAPLATVGAVYFGVGGRLGLGWLSRQVATLTVATHWQMLARTAMANDLSALARELARSVLALAPAPPEDGADADALIDAWQQPRAAALERCRQLAAEMRAAPAPDLAMLSVLLRELRMLV